MSSFIIDSFAKLKREFCRSALDRLLVGRDVVTPYKEEKPLDEVMDTKVPKVYSYLVSLMGNNHDYI